MARLKAWKGSASSATAVREAYGAVSLDDGITWKETNLSESATETSCDNANCDVQRPDIPLFADTDYDYPGDVVNIFHSIMGNQVLVAWPSRYCASGQPNYSLDNPEATPGADRPPRGYRHLPGHRPGHGFAG